MDSRNLGGPTGELAGIFSPKYLLQSRTLGEYVEVLISKSVLQTTEDSIIQKKDGDSGPKSISCRNKPELAVDPMYESLTEAITLGYTYIASSLLDLGVDPNSQSTLGRLGKVTDRKLQRAIFKSNPLHLACLRGNLYLVKKLLQKGKPVSNIHLYFCYKISGHRHLMIILGCKANSPDASGSFPIHLACSRIEDTVDSDEDDRNRLSCVKLLLDIGKTPLTIKDGNKQTILHSAARSGHCRLLKYIMDKWRDASEAFGIHFKSHNNIPGRIYDWNDRWYRTPVHWAVLNQRVAALGVLLDGGVVRFLPSRRAAHQLEQPAS